MKTQVIIIGGGPAGLLLAQLLHRHQIDNVILEQRSREYVLGRIRAGVLEQGTVDLLEKAGVGHGVSRNGIPHESIGIAFDNELHDLDVVGLTGGKTVTVYGQTEITRDLYHARDAMQGVVIDEAEHIELYDFDASHPYVTYIKNGQKHRIESDFIVGCDGFHGVSRPSMPAGYLHEYHLSYPFGWLGVLSETPPVANEVIYAQHERGFALCSMRHKNLSRYYIQVPVGDTIEQWSDDEFWQELKERLPDSVSGNLVTGPSIEKSIAPLRAFVADNLHCQRLFLAGDAGHIVPPTGAKGLNLAFSDVHYLSTAFIQHYRHHDESALNRYSGIALRRIWATVRFSLSCTKILHNFPDQSDFDRRVQREDLRHLVRAQSASQSFAENYVGLPFEAY